jgi:hypothetical protein
LKKHLESSSLWNNGNSRRFVQNRGIGCLSRISPEIYLKEFDKILENPLKNAPKLCLVLEAMWMRSYKRSDTKWQERKGEWSAINPVMKPFLLPTPEYEKQFLRALQKLDMDSLTTLERSLLKHALSYLH